MTKFTSINDYLNPIRTEIFGERVNLGWCFSHPRVYSFVFKPRKLRLWMWLKGVKSTIKSDIEIDMPNWGVSMTSYSNFVSDKLKVSTISCSGPSFSLIELKFRTGL